MNGYQIVSEALGYYITLKPFDVNLYKKTVSKKDQQLSHIDSQSEIQYTIYYHDDPCGFIGAIPVKNDKTGAFIQIVIFKSFRGKGIVKEAYNLLVKKHKFKTLYATIYKSNIASIKAHMKIGFKELPKNHLDDLVKQGRISRYQTRLYKEF